MGQQDSAMAVPLEDFLTEVVDLLQTRPDAEQVVVERAKWWRDAEVEDRYQDVMEAMSGVYRN